MLKLNLQTFSEGAGTAAASGEAAPSGVQAPAAAALEFKTRTGRKVSVDMTKDAAQKLPSEGQTPPASTKPSFEELIKGDYKDDFGKHVSSIVQDRLKNVKAAETERDQLKAEREKLAPALEALIKKHGLKDGDIEGLVSRITDDDALYEDEALEKGIPVETLKEMKKLESDRENLRRIQAERMQQEAIHQHFQRLTEQAEQVRQVYPGFDLRAELQNPQFAELVRPGVNVDVLTAYRVIHNDEIVGGAMQVSAQKTAEKLANAMRSNAGRPSENGLSPSSSAVDLKDDPKTWSRERMARAMDIVKRGGNPYDA